MNLNTTTSATLRNINSTSSSDLAEIVNSPKAKFSVAVIVILIGVGIYKNQQAIKDCIRGGLGCIRDTVTSINQQSPDEEQGLQLGRLPSSK